MSIEDIAIAYSVLRRDVGESLILNIDELFVSIYTYIYTYLFIFINTFIHTFTHQSQTYGVASFRS